MKKESNFPSHIFIQKTKGENLGYEERKVMTISIMENIPYSFFSHEDLFSKKINLNEETLVVGSVESYREAINQIYGTELNIDCFPKSLSRFLERKIWKGTKNSVLTEIIKSNQIFAKPLKTKLFTGQIFNDFDGQDILKDIDENEELYLSEIVSWTSEFRAYISNGKVIAICQYTGEEDDEPDKSVIEKAVELYMRDFPSHKHFTLDFGITPDRRTTLVELNDAWSIGAYNGISDKDYLNMLFGRWNEIMTENKSKKILKSNMDKIRSFNGTINEAEEFSTNLMIESIELSMKERIKKLKENEKLNWKKDSFNRALLWGMILESVEEDNFIDSMIFISLIAFKDEIDKSNNPNKKIEESDNEIIEYAISEFKKFMEQFTENKNWYTEKESIENVKSELKKCLNTKGWMFTFYLAATIYMRSF